MTYLIAEIAGPLVFLSALAAIIGWVARDFVVRWELTDGEPGTDLERKVQEQMELNMQLRDDLDTARMRLRDLDGQLAAREPERQALEAELSRRANTIKALEKGIENGRAQLALSNDALSRLRSEFQNAQEQLETHRVRLAMLEEQSRAVEPERPRRPFESPMPVAVDPEPAYGSAPEPPFTSVGAQGLVEDELIEALEAPELSEEIPFPSPSHAGVQVASPSGAARVRVPRGEPVASSVGALIASFDAEDPADMVTADVVIELGDEEEDPPEPSSTTVELESIEVKVAQAESPEGSVIGRQPKMERPETPVSSGEVLAIGAPLVATVPAVPTEAIDAELTPPRQARPAHTPTPAPVAACAASEAAPAGEAPVAEPMAESMAELAAEPVAKSVAEPVAKAVVERATPRAGNLTTNQARERLRAFVAELAEVVGGGSDDLQQIKGIGPKTSQNLANLGVTTYRHLAVLPDAEIEIMAKAIRYSPAKIRRSDWRGQARRLHQLKTGEQLA